MPALPKQSEGGKIRNLKLTIKEKMLNIINYIHHRFRKGKVRRARQIIVWIMIIFLLNSNINIWQIFTSVFDPSPTFAATETVTTKADWNSGLFDTDEIDAATSAGDLKLRGIGSGAWSGLSAPPSSMTSGSSAVYVANTNAIFVVRGGSMTFWKYDLATDYWYTLTEIPYAVGSGSKLDYDGDDTLYLLRGGGTASFYKYTISTDTWVTLADTPEVTSGGSMAYNQNNDKAYAAKGSSDSKFWEYDPSANTWTAKRTLPSADVGYGLELTYYNSKIYYQKDGYPWGAASTPMYEYDPADDSWTTKASGSRRNMYQSGITSDGTDFYIIEGGGSGILRKYNPAGNTWSALTSAPWLFNASGATLATNGTYLYVFKGGGQVFMRYTIAGDTWEAPAPLYAGEAGYGFDLTYYNGKLYQQVHGYPWSVANQAVYEYDPSTNTWSTKASANRKDLYQSGTTVNGSDFYVIEGGGSAIFRKYDVSGNSWSTLTSASANFNSSGGTVANDGTYVYAFQGGSTAFWRYTISSGLWDSSLAVAPASITTGASMMYVPSEGAIYAARGGSRTFWKYNIGGDSWSTLSEIPYTIGAGAKLEYDGDDTLYLLRGGNTTNVYRYTISTDTWETIASTHLATNRGALAYDTVNDYLYVASGNSTELMWRNSMPAVEYPSSGIHIKTFDLTYAGSWTSFSSSTTTPANTTVTFDTRVSTDSAHWSSWSTVTGGNIQSSAGIRYLQVRSTLATSDNLNTPTVASYNFVYTTDTTAPTNPSTILGYSSNALSMSLTDSGSYAYANPYFTWSGASDGQSWVDGYYIYFGTNVSADPETFGTYHISTNYEVREPMTYGQTYYLRIKTKDVADNISSAATEFTYVYNGVSPPSTEIKTSQADFEAGTLTNIDATTSAGLIKGATNEDGKWYGTSSVPYGTGSIQGSDLTYYNGKLYYYIRGYSWGAATTSVYEFDPSLNYWSAKASTSRRYMYQNGTASDGINFYMIEGGGADVFKKYDPEANSWSTLTAAPATFSASGATVATDGTYVYAFQGGSTNFWRYSISGNDWDSTLSVPSASSTTGSCMTYVASQGALFAARGSSRTFWKYTIATDTWSTLSDIPQNTGAGAKCDYDGDDTIYLARGGGTKSFYKYTISTDTWTTLYDAPGTNTYGSMVYDSTSRRVYMSEGSEYRGFFTYEVILNNWVQNTTAPSTTYNPAMEYDGDDTIYALRGYNTRTFWSYTISTNTWATLADTPYTIYYGTDLAYDGTRYVYALRGNDTDDFYRYDTQTDTWTTLSETLGTVYTGGGLVFNSDNGKLYALRGDTSQDFWEYDISGDEWTAKANYGYNVLSGIGLVYTGGYIYASYGQNNTLFRRYDVLGNTWSTMTAFPGAINSGSNSLVTDGTYIWALRNNGTNTLYRYNISGNSWTTLPNSPLYVTYGAFVKAGNQLFSLAGNGTNGFSYFVLPGSDRGYEYLGTYTSESMNLGNVYNWAGISATIASSSATRIEFETRSSTDSSNWNDWVYVTNQRNNSSTYTYSIESTVARYIQTRATFYSLDNISTPTLSDYTINYYKDEIEPSNPTGVTAARSATESAITTNNWLNSTSPYFSWDAASDGEGGSGIAGYYVYFGSDANADASTSGTLQTALTYEPTLTTDGEYYLKIKSVDDAGNISSADEESFHYRLDTSIPNKPSSVAADPRTYTAVNDFTMFWTSASDSTKNATSSSLLGYYYKSGATTGAFSTDQFTTSTQVINVPAYTNGVNTFYVKSVDNAGNESDYSEASYYYNGTAPSAPTNLTVTPSTNTSNSFAFSWGLPISYSGAISEYRYSINSLPTADNYTSASTTSLAAGAYATVKGTNVFYIVAVDEAGNVNYDAYASVNFIADTSAPGIPQNIEAFDNSIRATKQYKVGLTWDAPTDLGTGFAGYAIYGSATGTSCTSSFSSFTLAGTTAGTTYVVASLGGTALSSQTYYFCIKAYDSTNQYSAVSSTTSLLPTGRWLTAPTLTSNPVSTVKTKSATITWATSREGNSFVQYGTTSGSYGNEVGSSTQVTSHSINLTGLNPGTTYYYTVTWTDEDGNQDTSDEYTLTTDPAPVVKNVEVISIGISSAILQFTTTSADKAKIYYGPSTTFGGLQEVSTSTLESTYTIQLTGLTDDTKYYYKINPFDTEGTEYEGTILDFTTLPMPKISLSRITEVKGASTPTVLLTWQSNTAISSVVSYYPKSDPGNTKDEIDLNLKTGAHTMFVRNLLPNTDYIFVISGRDKIGTEAISDPLPFTTSTDTRAPQITTLTIEASNSPPVGRAGEVTVAQLVVAWNTDEPSTSQVEYGEGTSNTYSQKTQEDKNLTYNHLVVISGLTPSKVYHLRALSKDKAGNQGESIDTVTITPKAVDNALDLVITNLREVFGFLK